MVVFFFVMQEENQQKRRPKGSESVVKERKRLKTSGRLVVRPFKNKVIFGT